jgi:hypothetical protein
LLAAMIDRRGRSARVGAVLYSTLAPRQADTAFFLKTSHQ